MNMFRKFNTKIFSIKNSQGKMTYIFAYLNVKYYTNYKNIIESFNGI